MDDTTILGGVINQLGQTAKKTVQQIVKLPEEVTKGEKPTATAQNSSEPKQDWQSDEERIKFLKDLYGKSDMSKDGTPDPKKKPTEFQEHLKDKSPEEQKKLMELRQQLHKENYYDPTFNPAKNPPAGGEERPAEKVENEKKEEMVELQKKEDKKPKPLAVVREQNKAEMFRGAAG